MRKTVKLLCFMLVLSMLTGILFTGCGDKEKNKPKDTGKKVVLVNNTSRDIDGVIYFKAKPESKWIKLKSKSEIWENESEITLTIKGELPKSKEGCALKLTYSDTGESDIWTGIPIGSAKAISITPDSVVYPKKLKNKK